jgi:hypothetical protein
MEEKEWKFTFISAIRGSKAQRYKNVRTKTYTKGTPLKTVIEDLAHQAGLSANSAVGHLEKLNQALSRTIAVSGNPMAEVA